MTASQDFSLLGDLNQRAPLIGIGERQLKGLTGIRVSRQLFKNVPRNVFFFTGSRVAVTQQADWTEITVPEHNRDAPFAVTPMFEFVTTTANEFGCILQLRVTGIDQFGRSITETTPTLTTQATPGGGGPIDASSTPNHWIGWLSKCFSRVDKLEYRMPTVSAGGTHTLSLGIYINPKRGGFPIASLVPGVAAGVNEAADYFHSTSAATANADSFWNQGFGLTRLCRGFKGDDLATLPVTFDAKSGIADLLSVRITERPEPFLVMDAVADFDNQAGLTTIETTTPHNLQPGQKIFIMDTGAYPDSVDGTATVLQLGDGLGNGDLRVLFTILNQPGATDDSTSAGYIITDQAGSVAPAGAYSRGDNTDTGGFVIGQSAALDQWNGDPYKVMCFYAFSARRMLREDFDPLLGGRAVGARTELNGEFEAARDFEFFIRSTAGYDEEPRYPVQNLINNP